MTEAPLGPPASGASGDARTRRRVPVRVLASALIVALLVAAVFATRGLDARALDRIGGEWWAAPAVLGLYVALFTLGTPGSWLYVASGLVFTPGVATLLAVIGGTAGSLGAHMIGRWLGADARERWRSRRGYDLVRRSLDFWGLLALRLVPFVPHSLVNYGTGIAGARLSAFVPATALSIAAKAALYATISHRAARAPDPMAEVMKPEVFALLLAAAALSLGARWAVARRAAPAQLDSSKKP